MVKSWHSFSVKKTIEELKTRVGGLSEREAEKRLGRYGLNEIPSEKSSSKIRLFLRQIKSPLIYILIIAGVVAFLLDDYTDSVVIFAAVFLNTIIGYLQEDKASQALEKLKKVLQAKAVVFRGGEEREILRKNIVPGDIVFLRAGNKVPADARIIEARHLTINESVLTGEWLAAKKNAAVLPKETPLADRDNMAYMGTIIESGWAKAVVVKTGASAEVGQIAEMVREGGEKETPYQKKLSRLGKIVSIVVIIASFGIFLEGILRGENFVEIFTISIAVAVAAIPEGLPIAMTVVLALGMGRILKKKGLVRKLASAETLGSTSIILTDKTGTLTEAKMSVAGIFTGANELFKGGGFVKNKNGNHKERHIRVMKMAMLCNEAFVENLDEPTSEWIVRGAPTERALLLAGIQAGLSKRELEEKQPLIDKLFFDPYYKYAVSLRKLNDEKNILYLVGSPEKILSMSGSLDSGGKKEKLLLSDFAKIKNKIDDLTKSGLRVLAVAYKETKEQAIDRDEEEKHKEMVFVGLFTLHDPIRPGTKEVMDICRRAGMRPIIVTGDHKLTAWMVASKLGFNIKEEDILEGKDLAKMSDKELEKCLKKVQIYARVEPAQKLRIVNAWKKRGEVVAMTGDGINDAPALRRADIGVALGSGTDVAKDVSDMVLLTDNFNIIVAAIGEGRTIIDNIRKVITYLLSSGFTEIILIGVSLFFGWPLPVLAAQILWINLIVDGPIGISLAFEKREKDVMRQKPKDYGLSLLDKKMKILIFIIGIMTDFLLLGLLYWLLRYTEYDISRIRSIIFAGLAIGSLFYIFSCKSLRRNIWQINIFSNRYLIYAWLSGVLMLVAALYIPLLQKFLRTVPLNLFDWSLVLGVGFLNMVLIEATKYWFISRRRK
ncbi:HAD-IC family P-type ATPase [Patescibacteria group bacterium]|nr:HAD-IC family P-type ATPase [Patescibacteria group bacterium]MBU2579914.1 HAD-IC family P-type ATPase [Patescibacteria group bacterium]